MTPIKIAVGYVRCSTDMQDDSTQQQKKAIDTWAKGNSYTVIEWFEDEGKSGTSFDKRPAFMRMVKRIETSPNFEHVLVYDESRWGRAGNPRESTYWKVHLERHGVKVRIVNSQSKNENDIGSFVVEVVESAEASEYSKKLSRSTLRGCFDNASKGFSNGGSACYGYKRIAVDKVTGKLIRELLPGERRRETEEKVLWDLGDEAEVQTVQRIFQLKVAGYGYRTIADKLNTEKVPCPKRGRWRNKNQMWSTVTVQTIVTNPSYRGDRIYNRHPLSKKVNGEANVLGKTKERWVNDEREWIVQRDAHTAIISRELFEKANPPAVRHERGKRNIHYHGSPYLLTGLVKCERCGFNFQGQSYRRSSHFYYVDGGNMNKGKSVCDRTAIRRELLEGFVTGMVMDSLPFSKSATRLEGMIREYLNGHNRKDSMEASTEKRLQEIDRKMQNLLDAVEQGIGLDTVFARIKELENEKKVIEQDRSRITVAKGHLDPKEASSQAARFFVDFRKRFDKAPIEEKKALLRQVVLGVSVNPVEKVARCSITKIPMVSPALRSALLPSGFVGRTCSGDRT